MRLGLLREKREITEERSKVQLKAQGGVNTDRKYDEYSERK